MSATVPPTSSAALPAVPKTPFLAAAALFLGVAALIGALAIRPLGAAELLGLLACTAAAAVFTTIPFAIDLTRRLDANRRLTQSEPTTAQSPAEALHQSGDKLSIDLEALAARIAATVEARLDAQIEARLAAAEETRRAEIQAAIAATTPPRIHDVDTISPPAPAASGAAKPRLGRGLLGLMHAPSALTAKPAATEPATDDDRAAA